MLARAVMGVRIAIIVWAAGFSACADPLFLLHEVHERTPEGETLIEQSCQEVAESGGSGDSGGVFGPSLPRFSIDTRLFDDGAHVVVRGPTGERLANKVYDDDFLESGRRDEFTVQVDALTSLRFVFRGGSNCDFEDL